MLSQKHLESRFPLLGFAARSGTGKTTLLIELIPLLKSAGLRIGLIKHTHHGIRFDNAGLTQKLFDKGIDVYADSEQLSIYESHDRQAKTLSDTLQSTQHLAIDLMLIEGFKHLPFNKIELHRAALNQPLLCNEDSSIIAIASDVPDKIQALNRTLNLNRQVLNLNQPTEIYEWILHHYLANLTT